MTNEERRVIVKAEIKALKLELKAKAKERVTEIMFLKQVIQAREIQSELAFDELIGKPKEPWVGLQHNHLCEHCNETWRCSCLYGDYLVKNHGCIEQHEAAKRLAIALSMPSRWEAPYLSRRPRRKTKGPNAAAQIAANDAEIAHLREQLGAHK